MPFSHHSHSGQFCPGHARDSLEDVIQTAISKKVQVFALTEHMPRHDEDRYQEEIQAGSDLLWLQKNESEYFKEAVRLRAKYKDQIKILIGFEGEWIRHSSRMLIENSLRLYEFDLFLGSVHHVHTIPIDYDTALYHKAREIAGGTDVRIFEDYFDSQYDLLQTLKPPVISHFDLIRLKSDEPEGRSFKPMTGVWRRILRNLDYIASYDGVVELNFSAIRKGMSEPYPKAEICQEFLARGGKFCLSDDSHGVDQVALNYHQLLPFLNRTGIQVLHYLERSETPLASPRDQRFPYLDVKAVEIPLLKDHPFFR